MAATATYGSLLKRYTPEKLIENEFAKHNYIWAHCDKDLNWRGGTYEVPLLEAGFSTIQMGSLAADTNIAEMGVALGTQTMKELWASLLVREADLFRHGDMEQSYLKIMPERIEEFVKYCQQIVNVQLLSGGSIAKATANGDASGNITVDKPHMFRVGQQVAVDDDNSSEATGYVRTIDLNTGIIVIYDARTGGSVVDLSGYTTAQNAIVRLIGQGSESFLSMKEALLPAAQGGSASLYGLTKASYTVLQSIQMSGSAYTATSILDDLLGAYYTATEKRANVKEILVSYGVFKNIAKALEVSKRYVTGDKKSGYGFNSVDIVGAEGQAKIVALREMPNDVAYLGDVSKIKWAGAEPFKRKVYNGEEFYLKRGTTGPEFISDMPLRGNFIVKPSEWAVVHSLPAAVSA